MPDNEIIEDRTEIMKLKLDMKRKGIDPKRLDDLVEYGRVTEAGLKHERYMERARLKKEVEGKKELLKDSYMIAVINTGGDELMEDELRKQSEAVLRALDEVLKLLEI